ncbi:hypothetical protein K525DRAFT_283331 [Schizophyllum commune Loenen D]|nr:hypothetical protein K525DRAFT_283331 [Schizophyllum commune Loenen D]
MILRAHTNAWLHRHEDLDMASRTRNGPGEWNNPRDMENIPRVVKRDAFCFCFTPALPERSDIREDDRYFPPPPLHLPTTSLHAFLPPPRDSTVARMCGSRPPLEGMAFVLSFSTASDGASATYPNGASDSDAWARVPEIGIHPKRVSRGGRGKGLTARGNAASPRSATDTIGCPRLIQSFTSTRLYITGGTCRWRDGVAVRPRRPGHDSALVHCAWEKTLAGGDASFAEREDMAAAAAVEDRWLSRQRYILFAPGLRAGGSGSTLALAGMDVDGVGHKLDAVVSA